MFNREATKPPNEPQGDEYGTFSPTLVFTNVRELNENGDTAPPFPTYSNRAPRASG